MPALVLSDKGLRVSGRDEQCRPRGHFDRVRYLHPEVQKLFERDGLSLDPVIECFPFETLHHDEQAVLMFADVVDGTDVGWLSADAARASAEIARAPEDLVPVLPEGTSRLRAGPGAGPRPRTQRPFRRHLAFRRRGNGRLSVRACAANVRPQAEASQFDDALQPLRSVPVGRIDLLVSVIAQQQRSVTGS